MFCSAYVDDDVGTEVCHDQPVFCVVHVDDDVFSNVNHDSTVATQSTDKVTAKITYVLLVKIVTDEPIK